MISVQCPCGQSYDVKESMIGKRAKCQVCGETFVISQSPPPQAAEVVEEFVEVVEVAEVAPVAPAAASAHHAISRAAHAAPGGDDDERMQQDLDWIREKTQSTASNPGMLRVNYVRYAMAFPKWFSIWHGLFLFGILLTIFVHWGFAFLALLFFGPVYLYWRRVKFHFVGGCVNPGKVLSVDPPLMAVYSDLTQGFGDWPVVKIQSHPLSKMSSGRPKPGQYVATVATYQGMYQELEHWDDFYPVVADVVTSNQKEIQRVFNSIDEQDDDENWKEMEAALQQVPQPHAPGLYRIYDFKERPQPLDPNAMVEAVEGYLSEFSNHLCWTAQNQIDPAAMNVAISSYANGVNPGHVLALVESNTPSSGPDHGMLFTPQGLYLKFQETGPLSFPWASLQGAFLSEHTLELTLTTNQRIRIPAGQFRSDVRAPMELLLNTIIGRGE